MPFPQEYNGWTNQFTWSLSLASENLPSIYRITENITCNENSLKGWFTTQFHLSLGRSPARIDPETPREEEIRLLLLGLYQYAVNWADFHNFVAYVRDEVPILDEPFTYFFYKYFRFWHYPEQEWRLPDHFLDMCLKGDPFEAADAIHKGLKTGIEIALASEKRPWKLHEMERNSHYRMMRNLMDLIIDDIIDWPSVYRFYKGE